MPYVKNVKGKKKSFCHPTNFKCYPKEKFFSTDNFLNVNVKSLDREYSRSTFRT